MKKSLIFISLVFFLGNIFAQTLEQNIQEIRKQFKWVNSQKDFKKVVFENEEFTDQVPSEGCGLEIYYKNNNLYKMVENDAASVNLYTTEYYIKNNKLIFVYRKEIEYAKITEGMPSDPKVIYEDRVYYKNGKIIRHLEKGKSVLSKSLDYKKLFNEYKKYYETKVKYEKQYNFLQGIWINADNIDDWFEITGLRTEYYDKSDPYKTARLWFDGRYLWFHTSSYPEEDRKWEVLELTAKKLEVQDKLSSEVLIYKKKDD